MFNKGLEAEMVDGYVVHPAFMQEAGGHIHHNPTVFAGFNHDQMCIAM